MANEEFEYRAELEYADGRSEILHAFDTPEAALLNLESEVNTNEYINPNGKVKVRKYFKQQGLPIDLTEDQKNLINI